MTALAARPAVSARGGQLTGTGPLIKLALRRERIPLAIWIYGLSITVVSSFPTLKSLYPDAAAREAVASGIATNPAFLVMTGPVNSTSVGGLTAWRFGVLGATMVALMAIFTVVRRTRADEETGRTELLASGVLGRFAPLVSALAVAVGASLTIGAIAAVGAIVLGQPATGSVAFGAALAGPGVVFAGIAAVAAQLVESARAATAIAGACLGVAYGLRAVGDVSSGLGFFSWLSPIGWSEKVSAFGENRWWVVVLFPVAALLVTVAALGLMAGRDVGLGIWPARLGRATNPRLGTPLALAARLQRGPLIGWAVGFAALGAVSGGVADSSGNLLDNPKVAEIMHELGGPGALSDTLLAVMGVLGGLLAGAYAISTALRMSSEESAQRAAPVLATAVGRWQWMAGHLLFALIGPAALLAVGGVVTGLIHGARSGAMASGFGGGLASMMAQYAPAAVMGGLAVLLFGLLPRLTAISWGALGAALLLGQLGAILKLPRSVMGISPYTHVPAVPSVPVSWTSLIVLLLIAAALVAVGMAGFARRDVVSAG